MLGDGNKLYGYLKILVDIKKYSTSHVTIGLNSFSIGLKAKRCMEMAYPVDMLIT